MRYRKTVASPYISTPDEESHAEQEAFERLVQDYWQSMEKLEEIIMPEAVKKRRWRQEHAGAFAHWLQKPDARLQIPARIVFICLSVIFCFFVIQSVWSARILAFSYPLMRQASVGTPTEIVTPLAAQETISINTATQEELTALPGIGPTLAQRIVDERETNGIFHFPEDLLSVSGIGEKKLEAIRPLLSFEE